MNFLDADAVMTTDGPMAQFSDGQRLALDPRHALTDGQAIVVGVRPEHIAPSGPIPSLRGTVHLVEPTGAQTHVVVQMAGTDVVASIDGALLLRAGQPFAASIHVHNIFIFDKVAGERIV